ncbi:nucleotide disphospho-sugar-binding domain-containing protein [Ruminococcus sp. HUN007]|uniref:nucleotide disphospho-sugar-binding domain-containing protein n=1 Tax=Ruminococcus sp. HUN007 TaxID=1514668 RepID=UPI0005D2578E|nr:nucleotide disphospho-sugar-binding domain-containing protein [Ruminococcus sp. HUN007]
MNNIGKGKKIFVANGILHGHFTTSVELVRELVSLGYDVTCCLTDEFEARMNVENVKKIVYKIDTTEAEKMLPPNVPPFAINSFRVGISTDIVISTLLEKKDEFDYFIFDLFFDVAEMNKVLNIDPAKIAVLYVSYALTDVDQYDPRRIQGLQMTSRKYNINLHDFVSNIFSPSIYKKLIPVSKYFHLRAEDTDNTCYFIGPNIEKRNPDTSFTFKKDAGRKLVYVSLGTIFGNDLSFYHRCIEAFRDSEDYQVIMSVGRFVNIEESFKEIPANFTILNYVPQTQLLPEVDVFVTHAGYNSTTEGITAGVPLVMVPQSVDQFDVAKVTQNLNAGIELNKNEIDITSDVIRKAVDDAYNNRETFKKNMKTISDSFEEARSNREKIFAEIFA